MPITNFLQISKGCIIRIAPGSTIFFKSANTFKPAIFLKYDPTLDMVELKGMPAMNRTDLYTNCTTAKHLPESYILNQTFLLKMMPEAKRNLEEIMPSICQHCKPTKNCIKCPVRRIMNILTNSYNEFYCHLATTFCGTGWDDEISPRRAKYQKEAPAIDKSTTQKLVNGICTYCPGRKLTKAERKMANVSFLHAGSGDLPGKNCSKCPLYIHCKHNF